MAAGRRRVPKRKPVYQQSKLGQLFGARGVDTSMVTPAMKAKLPVGNGSELSRLTAQIKAAPPPPPPPPPGLPPGLFAPVSIGAATPAALPMPFQGTGGGTIDAYLGLLKRRAEMAGQAEATQQAQALTESERKTYSGLQSQGLAGSSSNASANEMSGLIAQMKKF